MCTTGLQVQVPGVLRALLSYCIPGVLFLVLLLTSSVASEERSFLWPPFPIIKKRRLKDLEGPAQALL